MTGEDLDTLLYIAEHGKSMPEDVVRLVGEVRRLNEERRRDAIEIAHLRSLIEPHGYWCRSAIAAHPTQIEDSHLDNDNSRETVISTVGNPEKNSQFKP